MHCFNYNELNYFKSPSINKHRNNPETVLYCRHDWRMLKVEVLMYQVFHASLLSLTALNSLIHKQDYERIQQIVPSSLHPLPQPSV